MQPPGRRVTLDLRGLGIAAVPLIGRNDYHHADDRLAAHAHPGSMEICYLAKGRQQFRVGGEVYHMAGGDVFLTFPDEPHDTGGSPIEKGRFFWLILLLPPPGGRFLLGSPADGRDLQGQLLQIRHRHFRGDPSLGKELEAVLQVAQDAHHPLRRVTLQNHLIRFLLGVIECARRHRPSVVSAKMKDLVKYLEANADRAIPLTEMAARSGLSLPRLKKRFKQELGLPPAEYALRCRVEIAKARLCRPRTTVTDVAFDLGFSSSQYFASVFRRFTGIAPTIFRRSA